MNFAGFQKILANTAAQIDKAVASTVQEVTGPKALSEYDIGEQVGSGGPGLLWKLYRAKPKNKAQQELSAEACVWVLDKKALAEERNKRGTSKAAEEALFDIFRADAKLLQRLRHPGVVRVVEALDENKAAMTIVTEPLFSSVANALGNYENMAKVPDELKHLELGQLEVKHGLLQLTETLSFLHKNAKMVHRSISPETVFLTTTGGWKFGGFGFSVMVDQVGTETEPPFHYPDFDVEAPVLPLQPLLDYSAPELIRKPIKSLMGGDTRTSTDIFSLALLTYHLVAKKPLLHCYNNQQSYLNKIMNLQRGTYQGIPLELENDLRRMLSQEAMARPTAHDFCSSPWYRDDLRLRALRFLDHMLERDNLQKTEFFKALSGLWSGFDPRVLRYKVLPPLLAELKNESILHFTLPLVLLIAENQNPRDFEIYSQSALMPVMQNAVGDSLLILVKHLPTLVSKASVEVMSSHVLPMLVRAYDDSDPRIQEETLRRTVDLALKLDFDLVKAAIVPRVHALALKTSVAAVRVHALICLGDLVQRLDRAAVMDILQTCARCASVDHSPPTLMCILAVADTIQKQQGVEFAAEHLLPLLTPLLVTQQLSSAQFAKFLRLVLDILHKIEEKRGVNLSEADSVSLDFAGLGASSTTLDLTGSNGPPKYSSAKPTTSWDATDEWGPISKQHTPSPNALPSMSSPLDSMLLTGSSTPLALPAPALTDSYAPWALPAPAPTESYTMLALPAPPTDPFSSLTSPPAGPSLSSLTPKAQYALSPSSPAASGGFGNESGMSMVGGSGIGLGTSVTNNRSMNLGYNAGVGSGLDLGPSAGMSSYSNSSFELTQLSSLSPRNPVPSKVDNDDPFADWPPRTTAGSILEPKGSASTSTFSQTGNAGYGSAPGARSGGGAGLGIGSSSGLTSGLGGMGAPMSSVPAMGVPNGGLNANDWSVLSGGGNLSLNQPQQPDLGTFFASPAPAPPPQQSGFGSMGSGGFAYSGTPPPAQGFRVGAPGPGRLAPPPPGPRLSAPPQGLGRGRGRGQVDSQGKPGPGAAQNQGHLLDLL